MLAVVGRRQVGEHTMHGCRAPDRDRGRHWGGDTSTFTAGQEQQAEKSGEVINEGSTQVAQHLVPSQLAGGGAQLTLGMARGLVGDPKAGQERTAKLPKTPGSNGGTYLTHQAEHKGDVVDRPQA